jgi:hypothetical protein
VYFKHAPFSARNFSDSRAFEPAFMGAKIMRSPADSRTADPRAADPRAADPRTRALRAGATILASALLVFLALSGLACPGHSAQPKTRTPLVIFLPIPVPILVVAPTRVATPAPQPDPVALTLVGCSHGTVGISTVHAPQPHWVIASLHLRTCRPMKNLRLTSIELLDKTGQVVVRSTRTEAFRIGKPQVNYPDRCLPYARRRPHHLSKAATRPFDGSIAPKSKHRLWLHVRMAGDYGRAARARPTTCRITFTTATGKIHRATIDQVGTWPTG